MMFMVNFYETSSILIGDLSEYELRYWGLTSFYKRPLFLWDTSTIEDKMLIWSKCFSINGILACAFDKKTPPSLELDSIYNRNITQWFQYECTLSNI